MDTQSEKNRLCTWLQSGKLRVAVLERVNYVKKTKFSKEPQYCWTFKVDNEIEVTLWSGLRITPRSKVGRFVKSMMGWKPDGHKFDPQEFVGDSAYCFYGKEKNPKTGEFKDTIKDFEEM